MYMYKLCHTEQMKVKKKKIDEKKKNKRKIKEKQKKTKSIGFCALIVAKRFMLSFNEIYHFYTHTLLLRLIH